MCHGIRKLIFLFRIYEVNMENKFEFILYMLPRQKQDTLYSVQIKRLTPSQWEIKRWQSHRLSLYHDTLGKAILTR